MTAKLRSYKDISMASVRESQGASPSEKAAVPCKSRKDLTVAEGRTASLLLDQFLKQQTSSGRGNLSEAEMFVAKAEDIWKGVRTTSHTEAIQLRPGEASGAKQLICQKKT
ncbi:hypothetical protein AV530_005087 [Patagioenas fasciata monilis]|uniref:Uncharacterized protein n=1 Tax=Patagioenas fasciata monilis TaxID=372326 RepID=A0A1V4K404_PATFA|nr:hypothetical protein AV530_005087 [Patagioenas fasciata monilis]